MFLNSIEVTDKQITVAVVFAVIHSHFTSSTTTATTTTTTATTTTAVVFAVFR